MFDHCLRGLFSSLTAEEFLTKYGWYLLYLTVASIALIDYLIKMRARQVNTRVFNEGDQFEVPC